MMKTFMFTLDWADIPLYLCILEKEQQNKTQQKTLQNV